MGLMGSGKTTLGRQLASSLNWNYSDSDEELQQRTGLTGAQFSEAHGIDALHTIEAALVLMALGSTRPTVITAAGSTIENPIVRRMIGSAAHSAYLDVPEEELERRQLTGHHRRALAPGELAAQLTRRGPLFEEVADITLPAGIEPSEALTILRVMIDRHPQGERG